jgi:hypothetical protein
MFFSRATLDHDMLHYHLARLLAGGLANFMPWLDLNLDFLISASRRWDYKHTLLCLTYHK